MRTIFNMKLIKETNIVAVFDRYQSNFMLENKYMKIKICIRDMMVNL